MSAHGRIAGAVPVPRSRRIGACVRFARAALLRLGPIAVLLLLWQWSTAVSTSPFFPEPTTIADRMHELWFAGPWHHAFLTDTFWSDAGPSVLRALSGWLLGAAIGVAVGLVVGQWSRAAGYIDPPVTFLRSLPKPAIIPVFLLVFGAGNTMRIGLIAFGCIWPVLLNTMNGVRSIGPTYLETARAFHIPRRTRITRIVIPAALPQIAAGMRITLSLSLILMVLSEWLLADSGLGHFLINAQRTFELVDMWAALVLLGLLGYLLNVLFVAAEKRILRWHRNVSSNG